MGPILTYAVEVFDSTRPHGHQLAEFQRMQPAIRAARLALSDQRVTLAVVKDRDGAMVYAAERGREWSP